MTALHHVLARLNRPQQTSKMLAALATLHQAYKVIGASANGIEKQLIREQAMGYGMIVRDEMWKMTWDPTTPACKIRCVYSVAENGYVGEEAWAKRLISRGIVPTLASPDLTVCSIGFSKRRNSWSGWSHRAICEFHIGDRIFDPNYGDDSTPYSQHGEAVITTLEDAKQAAINFAEYVS